MNKQSLIYLASIAVLVILLPLMFSGCVRTSVDQSVHTLIIEADGQGLVTPIVGVYKHKKEEIVVLNAQPVDGWRFIGWEGTIGEIKSSKTTISMNKNHKIKAVFVQENALGKPVIIDPKQPTYFADGVSLDFTALTLPDGVTVTVTEVADDGLLPDGLFRAGAVVSISFSHEELDFSSGVLLEFPLDDPTDHSNIGIFHRVNDQWEYQDSIIENGKIFAVVTDFSIYTVLAASRVEPPESSQAGESILQGTRLGVTCPTPGTTIYISTTGGNWPEEFVLYNDMFFMPNHDFTIYAVARKSNMLPSPIVKFDYYLKEVVPPLSFILTVNQQGQGLVSVDPDLPNNRYEAGSEVTLTAEALEGWQFVRWEGDVTATTPEITVVMNWNTSVNAIFEQHPYLTSIDQVPDVTVEIGTDESQVFERLASFTTITDSSGSTHTVELMWRMENYNPYEAGVYYAIGEFSLPENVGYGDSTLLLMVQANVYVEAELPYFQHISAVKAVTAPYATTEEDALDLLSLTTIVVDSNQQEHKVVLDWIIKEYDGFIAGDYDAIATFALPDGVQQPEPPMELVVTVTITVLKPALPSIAMIDPVSDLLVNHNTRIADVLGMLAHKTTITDSASVDYEVDLDWDLSNYDADQPGTYQVVGVFELPYGVEQADPIIALEVRPTITVKEAYPRFDVSISGVGSFGMVLALAGTFPVGVNSGSYHTVDQSFWIGETEVTYKLWYEVRRWAITNHDFIFDSVGQEAGITEAGAPPSHNGAFRPVTGMSWYDAVIWCNALSMRSGLDPVYYHNGEIAKHATILDHNEIVVEPTDGYRLPTSDEWELAARYQGSNRVPISIESPYGSGIYWTLGNYASGASANVNNAEANQEVAWYRANSVGYQNVGLKRPNALGLYDMSGNVSEWCFTAYSLHTRVARGGDIGNDHFPLRIGWDTGNDPSSAYGNLGFRLARSSE